MNPNPATGLTVLLHAHANGDSGALNRIVPLVYDELRRIARIQARRTGGDHTLDTTGLVHEAYLRLIDQSQATWRDRGHFFAVCALAMRQILVDRARARLRGKRGGGAEMRSLDEVGEPAASQTAQLLDVDRALDKLGSIDPRLVRVVECRYFAGFTEQETAEALGVSLRTAQREWLKARAWLRQELVHA